MAPNELPFRIEGRRIWVAGHRGMVGSAVVRRLAGEACEVLTVDRDRLDLRRQPDVQAWMRAAKPDAVILTNDWIRRRRLILLARKLGYLGIMAVKP